VARRLGTSAIVASALLALPAVASAAYTSAPSADVDSAPGPPVPGTLMTGDGADDALTVTIGPSVLAHDRFGVDPGFASAEDFDTGQPGVQTFGSDFATRLMVDGGTGQDTLRFADGRDGAATDWLHAGSVTGCVGQVMGGTSVSTLCYRAPTIDGVTLDGGSGDDRVSSLDAPPTTPLTLTGGDGDDDLSQDGEDGFHVLDSPVSLLGGPGVDQASFTEDQDGSLDYTIGDGRFQGTGYAPVSYDDTAELVTLYTRLGPDNRVTITEQGAHAVTVWSAGGTIDARRAGARAEVLARPSLFALPDQGGIRFRGGPADDVFLGTDVKDRASGGGGSDQLIGEGGNDRLNGGDDADFFDAGSGRDRIGARDRRRDTIDCGEAKDRAKTDRREGSVTGCELVKRPRRR
jgi:Ca2+-binding RTX toxin-like protein